MRPDERQPRNDVPLMVLLLVSVVVILYNLGVAVVAATLFIFDLLSVTIP